MVERPKKDCQEIIDENPEFQPVSDTGAIEAIVDQVLSENAQSVSDYLEGKTKAFAYLVGQVMKACQGKAPPPIVNKLLQEKLEKKKSK